MGWGSQTPGGHPGSVDAGFFEPYGVDPSIAPGLARPIGWRVGLPDGTGAWDKTGPLDTDWMAVGAAPPPTPVPGWNLVDEIEVLAATQTVVFSGLTGSPLKYRITGHLNPLLLANILARPNGVTTNLAFQGTVSRNNGTVLADSGNTLKFALTGPGTGSSCQLYGELEAPTGQGFRVGRSMTPSEMVTAAFFDFNMYSWVWRESVTPITSFTLFHAGGLGIGIGSKFQLWELTT